MEDNAVAGVAYSRDEAKVSLISVADRPGVAAAIFGPLADAGINVDMIVQNISEDGRTDMTFSCPVDELARAKKAIENAKDAGSTTRGDAGGACDHWWGNPSIAAAVLRPRDPEPDGDGGNLSTPGGATRPVHV